MKKMTPRVGPMMPVAPPQPSGPHHAKVMQEVRALTSEKTRQLSKARKLHP
jgi:hypothetical protein